MNPPLLELIGVSANFLRDGETPLVIDANWRVAAGDFWCVSGAGGAGKTDFLMLAAGLHTPGRGTVEWFGASLPETEAEQLAQRLKVGLVFDGGKLLNQLTVAENIALPLRYHRELAPGELAERVKLLLDFAELTPWANSTPGTLGRNWQKRAGLARALALQPELLLVDNPLGGADARHIAWWHTALGQITPTLVVTADDAAAWRGRARQFARLHEGKLELQASAASVDAPAAIGNLK
jgi:ABC-type transporter Mla maintaining outer membrane lipid asymmetry ATPase subunit MlaF